MKFIQIAEGEQFESLYITRMHEQRDLIVEDSKNKTEQFVINLKAKGRLSILQKLLVLIELICVLGVVYLAGKWSIDPSGNYEPYIVVLGAVSASLEIGRRIWKKSAT